MTNDDNNATTRKQRTAQDRIEIPWAGTGYRQMPISGRDAGGASSYWHVDRRRERSRDVDRISRCGSVSRLQLTNTTRPRNARGAFLNKRTGDRQCIDVTALLNQIRRIHLPTKTSCCRISAMTKAVSSSCGLGISSTTSLSHVIDKKHNQRNKSHSPSRRPFSGEREICQLNVK